MLTLILTALLFFITKSIIRSDCPEPEYLQETSIEVATYPLYQYPRNLTNSVTFFGSKEILRRSQNVPKTYSPDHILSIDLLTLLP